MGRGGALLLQFSLSARFFNFTPHFPPRVIQPHASTDFMGNRQAAAGLSVASLSPGGMQDHRRYGSERTRGSRITNESLKCLAVTGAGKQLEKHK